MSNKDGFWIADERGSAEPVAWQFRLFWNGSPPTWLEWECCSEQPYKHFEANPSSERQIRPLYTAPPERSDVQGAERADAARLDWLVGKLFLSAWNGVVGSGARTHWRIASDYRRTMQHFVGDTLRTAIDAARAQGGKG